MKKLFCLLMAMFIAGGLAFAKVPTELYETDTIKTKQGDLVITFAGHGSLMFQFNQAVIHVDPVSRVANWLLMPKPDLVLITHDHGDHLDLKTLDRIKKEKTVFIGPEKCAAQLEGCLVMKNGEKKTVLGLEIEAIPAYNIQQKRPSGEPFHVKGEGSGYIVTFADKRVYIAGDTENTAEMKALKKIDIAFLPMNLPYTMTPEMVADGAKAFKPAILYPYHYGSTDTSKLVELLKAEKGIEVRIRHMYPDQQKTK